MATRQEINLLNNSIGQIKSSNVLSPKDKQLLTDALDRLSKSPITSVPATMRSSNRDCTTFLGDTNEDGTINVVDIVGLVNHILTNLGGVGDIPCGDKNGDGTIDVIDIIEIVNLILNPPVSGCTDENACNYDETANTDDGSCEEPTQLCGTGPNTGIFYCTQQELLENCVTEYLGCTDTDACNFDADANIDDGTCEYPLEGYNCSGECVAGEDCNGECGGNAVEDCSGECGGQAIQACGMMNYMGEIFHGECCNYSPQNFSGFFDCTGIPPDCFGECGGTAHLCNGGDCVDNASECVEYVQDLDEIISIRSVDINAQTVTIDFEIIDIDEFDDENQKLKVSWQEAITYYDISDTIEHTYNTTGQKEITITLYDNFIGMGNLGDVQDSVTLDVYIPEVPDEVVPGCTDSNACNYESEANTDDNSCTYPEGVCDCDGILPDGVCNCQGETSATVCGSIYRDCFNSCACYNDVDSDGTCDEEDDCVGESMDCGCNTPMPDGDCDCDGNVEDECGICGGLGAYIQCYGGSTVCNVDDCPDIPDPDPEYIYGDEFIQINDINVTATTELKKIELQILVPNVDDVVNEVRDVTISWGEDSVGVINSGAIVENTPTTFSSTYSSYGTKDITIEVDGLDVVTLQIDIPQPDTIIDEVDVNYYYGCTELQACNYNFGADETHINDGSCYYPFECPDGSYNCNPVDCDEPDVEPEPEPVELQPFSLLEPDVITTDCQTPPYEPLNGNIVNCIAPIISYQQGWDTAMYGCVPEGDGINTLLQINDSDQTGNKRIYFMWQQNNTDVEIENYYITIMQYDNPDSLILDNYPVMPLGGALNPCVGEGNICGSAVGEINRNIASHQGSLEDIENYSKIRYISVPLQFFDYGHPIKWVVKLKVSGDAEFNERFCSEELYGSFYIANVGYNVDGCIDTNALNYNPAATTDLQSNITNQNTLCDYEIPPPDLVYDYQNNGYIKATIGSQIWMTESLISTVMNDGITLDNIFDGGNPSTEWQNNQIGYAQNDLKTHYKWDMTQQNICPNENWKVPSVEDWIQLFEHIEVQYGINPISWNQFNVGRYLKALPMEGPNVICQQPDITSYINDDYSQPTDQWNPITLFDYSITGTHYNTTDDCEEDCWIHCTYVQGQLGKVDYHPQNNSAQGRYIYDINCDQGAQPEWCQVETICGVGTWDGNNQTGFNAVGDNIWPSSSGFDGNNSTCDEVYYWTSDSGYAIKIITGSDLVEIEQIDPNNGLPIRCIYSPEEKYDCNEDGVPSDEFGLAIPCTEQDIINNTSGCAFYDTETMCGQDGIGSGCNLENCLGLNPYTLTYYSISEQSELNNEDCNCQCIGGNTDIDGSELPEIDDCGDCYGGWSILTINSSDLGCGCHAPEPQLYYPDNNFNAYNNNDGNPDGEVNVNLPYYFCESHGDIFVYTYFPEYPNQLLTYYPPDILNYTYPLVPNYQPNNFVPDWEDAPPNWHDDSGILDEIGLNQNNVYFTCNDESAINYDGLCDNDDILCIDDGTCQYPVGYLENTNLPIVEIVDGNIINIYKSELDEQVSIDPEFLIFESSYEGDASIPGLFELDSVNSTYGNENGDLNLPYSDNIYIKPLIDNWDNNPFGIVDDYTLSKTALTNYLFDEMGNQIVDFKFVDVVYNGEYIGTHLFYPGISLSVLGVISDEVIFTEMAYKGTEFFELYNKGNSIIDIGGWHPCEGVTNSPTHNPPPNTTLDIGNRIVWAEWDHLTDSRFDDLTPGINLFGYGGGLSGGGETVSICDSNGVVVSTITYTDDPPWPAGPDDVNGMSMQLINVDCDNTLGGNWKNHNNTGIFGGDPGLPNDGDNVQESNTFCVGEILQPPILLYYNNTSWEIITESGELSLDNLISDTYEDFIIDVNKSSYLDYIILQELRMGNIEGGGFNYSNVYATYDGSKYDFGPLDSLESTDSFFNGFDVKECQGEEYKVDATSLDSSGWLFDYVETNLSTQLKSFITDSNPFLDDLISRWNELRGGVLSDEKILYRVDYYYYYLDDRASMNYRLGNYQDSTFDEEINNLRTWLMNRIYWIDHNIRRIRHQSNDTGDCVNDPLVPIGVVGETYCNDENSVDYDITNPVNFNDGTCEYSSGRNFEFQLDTQNVGYPVIEKVRLNIVTKNEIEVNTSFEMVETVGNVWVYKIKEFLPGDIIEYNYTKETPDVYNVRTGALETDKTRTIQIRDENQIEIKDTFNDFVGEFQETNLPIIKVNTNTFNDMGFVDDNNPNLFYCPTYELTSGYFADGPPEEVCDDMKSYIKWYEDNSDEDGNNLVGYYQTKQTCETQTICDVDCIDGTNIQDEPKIAGFFELIYNGEGAINNINDEPQLSTKVGIEARGYSSRGFAKKQYAMELQETKPFPQCDDGAANYNLFCDGFKPEEGEDYGDECIFNRENDFVLLGPFRDRTYMRNAITYELWDRMGNIGTNSKYFEFILNDVYMGLYVMFEKPKIDEHRVPIETEITDTADSSGGWMIKVESGAEQDYFIGYDSYTKYEYYDPSLEIDDGGDDEEILEVQSARQIIQNTIKEFEKRVIDDYGQVDIEEVAHIVNFVDYWLIQEFARNNEGFTRSQYWHSFGNYAPEGYVNNKIYISYVWDMNHSFAATIIDYDGWSVQNFFAVPKVWGELFLKPWFQEEIYNRYVELKNTLPIFNVTEINKLIDKFSNEIASYNAVNRDQKRWFEGEIEDFNIYIKNFKKYILQRISWMDIHICSGGGGGAPFISADSDNQLINQTITDICPNDNKNSNFLAIYNIFEGQVFDIDEIGNSFEIEMIVSLNLINSIGSINDNIVVTITDASTQLIVYTFTDIEIDNSGYVNLIWNTYDRRISGKLLGDYIIEATLLNLNLEENIKNFSIRNIGKTNGCTDTSAVNFDMFAIQDDGSCKYQQQCNEKYNVSEFITDVIYLYPGYNTISYPLDFSGVNVDLFKVLDNSYYDDSGNKIEFMKNDFITAFFDGVVYTATYMDDEWIPSTNRGFSLNEVSKGIGFILYVSNGGRIIWDIPREELS
jgi:hypothetical protein